ncbi:MAG: hypothetical protein Q8S18_10980 [Bacteroidales bacterium]|nr:hypothetical protein [Bacteroidales bacterium]
MSVFLLLSIKLQSQQCVDCNSSNTTNGSYSSAIGTNNHADGDFSFVAGENSRADGRSSFSFGQSSKVYDNYALGIGRYLDVYGSSSLAIGRFLRTLTPDAMVIGYGYSETQTLDNNINRSLMIGLESTKPTFFVGPSSGVNNTGRIGIGNVTSPQAKLHIRADANEPATLRLEATGTLGDNIFSRILFTPNHIIQAADNQNFTFYTQGEKHFVFQNGNVGIGIASPRGKLDVLGNAFIEGIVYTEEVIVEEASNWPDYVFEPDYQLMNLADLKNYIDINKHLPDTPKADENGNVQNLKLGEMNGLLLKKIEELTLYILEQEERIRRLENALEQ